MIESIEKLQSTIRDFFDQDVQAWTLKRILKRHTSLRYRKIKLMSHLTNHKRSLVQRQQSALKLIEALSSGKRVINVDESWLSHSRFHHQAWLTPYERTSVNIGKLPYRLSMIAGICNRGECYFTLSQSNTNSKSFGAFLLRLAELLDEEDKNWRDSTLILLDNAKWHGSDDMMKFFSA